MHTLSLRAGNFGKTLTKSSPCVGDTLGSTHSVQDEPNEQTDLPTVLVLDDEPFVRQAARRFLKGSGYGCIEADTVAGALEALRTKPIVAAMLDMRLPDGRTGVDLLNDLRQMPGMKEIPVLIVTGSVLTDAEQAAITRQRGFVFFKPEGFSTIVKFLDQLTGRDRSS